MSDGLIVYPFPLPGRQICIRLYLPTDLTMPEVRRITAFLETLVIPDEELDVKSWQERQARAMANMRNTAPADQTDDR